MSASTDIDETVAGARAGIIGDIRDAAQSLLLDPAASASPIRAGQAADALAHLLSGYEKAVRTLHSSSSPEYAFKDLRVAEKDAYQAAKHLVDTLEKLYPA